jgi:hypothetical protein
VAKGNREFRLRFKCRPKVQYSTSTQLDNLNSSRIVQRSHRIALTREIDLVRVECIIVRPISRRLAYNLSQWHHSPYAFLQYPLGSQAHPSLRLHLKVFCSWTCLLDSCYASGDDCVPKYFVSLLATVTPAVSTFRHIVGPFPSTSFRILIGACGGGEQDRSRLSRGFLVLGSSERVQCQDGMTLSCARLADRDASSKILISGAGISGALREQTSVRHTPIVSGREPEGLHYRAVSTLGDDPTILRICDLFCLRSRSSTAIILVCIGIGNHSTVPPLMTIPFFLCDGSAVRLHSRLHSSPLGAYYCWSRLRLTLKSLSLQRLRPEKPS